MDNSSARVAADINAKYGREPGLKIYSHLSDHFASFGSRIMSATTGEAPYVLDGLMGRTIKTAAIYTNRQGRFTDRSIENQEHRASGLNLLIAAISYLNTLYMDRAAQHLKASRSTFDDALLAHLSPMARLKLVA